MWYRRINNPKKDSRFFHKGAIIRSTKETFPKKRERREISEVLEEKMSQEFRR